MSQTCDLSALQNFKINTSDTFTNWNFDHEEY